MKNRQGAGTVTVELEVQEGGVGGESAEMETEAAKIQFGEVNRAKRRVRGSQTRLAAAVELVILGRGEGDKDVVADKLKVVSPQLLEAVKSTEGVVDKNDTEQSPKKNGAEGLDVVNMR